MDFSLHHTIESVIRGAALPQMQQDAGSNGPGGHVVEETESLETMILNAAASSATVDELLRVAGGESQEDLKSSGKKSKRSQSAPSKLCILDSGHLRALCLLLNPHHEIVFKALHIIDQGRITCYFATPMGNTFTEDIPAAAKMQKILASGHRYYFSVASERFNRPPYTCFVDLHCAYSPVSWLRRSFCSCENFSSAVLHEGPSLFCKHILAIRLALAAEWKGTAVVERSSDALSIALSQNMVMAMAGYC